MPSFTWLLATAALLAVPGAADDAHLYYLDNVPDWQMEFEMTLQVSSRAADILPLSYSVIPLTPAVGLKQTQTFRNDINVRGYLVEATQSNYNNITNDAIAYLCCDNSNSTFIDPDRMLQTLMGNTPRGIILYSQTGNCCGISGTDLTYNTIFTMAYAGDASQTLNISNTSSGLIRATVSGNASSGINSQETRDGNNSAIAMSILYSITGLITLLFLIIIGTGAVRAHRYPERYGPRSGYGGRPRQSRAKGIARAVLETIPIVKFGDPTPAKPDPNIELEGGSSTQVDSLTSSSSSNSNSNNNNSHTTVTTTKGVPGLGTEDVQVHHLSTIPEDAETLKTPRTPRTPMNLRDPGDTLTPMTPGLSASASTSAPDRAADGSSSSSEKSAGGAAGSPLSDDEHLGCSICTEDFTVGEDVRVLPCNHKFHPNCVDPWLVNVSGTCPLCRLDLRPNDGDMDGRASAEMHLPPPLEDDEAAAAAAESSANGPHRHRVSRLFDLNRLRHASAEERIEVLRQYRSEAQTTPAGFSQASQASAASQVSASQVPSMSLAPADGEDEHSRSAKLTRRLRDKFHIRTRTQSPEASGARES